MISLLNWGVNDVKPLIGYHGNINNLELMGYSKGLNLFSLPYDWR